ncbi:transposase, partial [Aurantimonas sp. C2-4-R8]|nr:transposase [Aurantimonas sp. C2-4-R8]
MPQKKHKPEEIVAKLRQVDVLVSQGRSVAEAVRAISVTQFTYYRWRKEFGGLKGNQVKRLKDLEKEKSYGRFWVTRLDQAARLSAPCVATPSVNVTPLRTIGNWFA